MSGNKKFTPMALDKLLNDAMEDTNQLQNELKTQNYDNGFQEDDDIVPAPAVSPQINQLVDKQSDGAQVDYSRVYGQLERLIENGNIALQVLGAIDPDVSGVEIATATASLMNAVKNCVAEFTKIHMQHLKFQQMLHAMKVKHQYKMEEMEMRRDLYNGNATPMSSNKPTEMIEWEAEGATAYIKFLQDKNKKE